MSSNTFMARMFEHGRDGLRRELERFSGTLEEKAAKWLHDEKPDNVRQSLHVLLTSMRSVVAELGLSAELRGIDRAIDALRDEQLGNFAALTPVVASLISRKGHAVPRKATETWVMSLDARDAPQAAGEDRRMIHGIRQAWSSRYAPSSLEALRDYIRDGQGLSGDAIYGRTIVFVQSSGMGKSRLAAEFAQSCPAINYVLREEKSKGFPPADLEILAFLRSQLTVHQRDKVTMSPRQAAAPGETEPAVLERRADLIQSHSISAALLWASVEELHYFISTWLEQRSRRGGRLSGKPALREVASAISAAHKPPEDEEGLEKRSRERIRFCTSVVRRATTHFSRFLNDARWRKAFDDLSPSTIRHTLEDSLSVAPFYEAFESLVNLLESKFVSGADEALLVVQFDEASSLLFNHRGDAVAQPHLYVALNRIISCLRKHRRAWFFFLSTESNIRTLLPWDGVKGDDDDSHGDGSGRILHKDSAALLRRLPPFVSFQVDVTDRELMRRPASRNVEERKPLVELGTTEHLALFGRPLWTAYTDNVSYLHGLAKQKLLGGKKVAKYDPTNADEVFAVVSFRVHLDVCSHKPQTYGLSRKVVDSHMIVVTGLQQTEGLIYTLTPSEPVLAIAAMSLLRPEKTWARSIATLNSELLSKGLVDKGTKGELFARLLLVLARDALRPALPPNPMPPFTLRQLLYQLFDASFHPSIACIDASLLDGLLNFTHFTATAADLTVDELPDLLLDLLRRGAALQLSPRQPLYDLLMPIYLGPASCGPVDRARCGVVVIQVKNRRAATTPDAVFQEDFERISPVAAAPKTVYAPERSQRRFPSKFVFGEVSVPVVFVMLDLGVSGAAMGAEATAAEAAAFEVSRSKDISPKDVATARKMTAMQTATATTTTTTATTPPPRIWALHARGHGSGLFRCLASWQCHDEAQRFFDESVPAAEEMVDEAMIRYLDIFRQVNRDWRYPPVETGVRADEKVAERSGEGRGVGEGGNPGEGSGQASGAMTSVGGSGHQLVFRPKE